ncbi:HpcH/HpaI aldolase/citrate lyase family protein [Pseudokordiimonas caeni]|uniref:HpcH/HpaI aldolase/citrate lyase family protein n=1 Tax=Pseudokordiimonas caeni TaxID=2997908 RepID=UPI002811C17F|nr:CoA ester lyase [Pseudokordiimonas caeni]
MTPETRIPVAPLFMPASNARAIEKARGLSADAIILDLEDAVSPDAKAIAREQAVAAVREGGFGDRLVAIRINALDTPWGGEDLAAVIEAGARHLVVPKVETAAAMADLTVRLDVAQSPARVWAMIETPKGVLAAVAIAAASPRLAGLILGANDLVKEMRARHVAGRAPLLYAMGQVVTAARAAGIGVIDAVYADFRDEAGFSAECRQALEFGFDGKSLIHPAQTPLLLQAFSPSADELQAAKELVEIFERAAVEGKGVAVHNGRMIEALHVEEARRVLARGGLAGVTPR